MGKLLLGVDAGTSSVKAALFEESGRAIAESTEAVPILNPGPEFAEQSMEDVWKSVCAAVIKCLSKGGVTGRDIAAVGVSGQGTGCWLLDARRKPLGNAIIWIDGRAKGLLDAWKREGKDLEVFRLSSNSLFTGSPAVLLAWLKMYRPSVFAEARYLLFAKDWVRLKLTGEIATDRSDLFMFPLPLEGEMAQVLDILGIPEAERLIPPVHEAWHVVGSVTQEASEATGLQAGTPVVTGLVDVASCALALGVIVFGQVYSILGTTSFNAFMVEQGPVLFEPQRVGISVAYLFPRAFLRAMATMSGTLSLDWFLENFFEEDRLRYPSREGFFSFLEERMAEIPPGSEGVIFLPYISPGGERAPFLDPHAQGIFFGLRYDHTKFHLLKAVYEGIAFSILDCFSAFSLSFPELRFCGGGAKSPFWCQLVADVLGTRIVIPQNRELGALGAALLAGVGVGMYRDVRDAVEKTFVIKQVFIPRQELSQFYRERFSVYRSLREHLGELWIVNDGTRMFSFTKNNSKI